MQIRSKINGGLALGALAAIFTFGNTAQACNLGGSVGSRYLNLDNASVKAAASQPDGSTNPKDAASELGSGAIQGLWQVTFASGGQVVDMAFEVFHSDGTEMINDITPPAEGNVCLGVWTQVSHTGYKLTHVAWSFDSSGNLLGTELFKVNITMASANRFSGSYTLSTFDVNGNPGPVYTGTMTATRVTPGN